MQAYYMERDAREVAAVKEGVPISLQTFYIQVTLQNGHALRASEPYAGVALSST